MPGTRRLAAQRRFEQGALFTDDTGEKRAALGRDTFEGLDAVGVVRGVPPSLGENALRLAPRQTEVPISVGDLGMNYSRQAYAMARVSRFAAESFTWASPGQRSPLHASAGSRPGNHCSVHASSTVPIFFV